MGSGWWMGTDGGRLVLGDLRAGQVSDDAWRRGVVASLAGGKSKAGRWTAFNNFGKMARPTAP